MKYNVLIIGSGAREHAIAYRINQSSKLKALHCIPGNPGIQEISICSAIQMEDFESINNYIHSHHIDILICGPEGPLSEGLIDYLSEHLERKCILIGPNKAGAKLESSKKFAKEFMIRHNIPTARYSSFNTSQLDEAKNFILNMKTPIVLKADGLAAGKGVIIAQTHLEAVNEIELMLNGKFGLSSKEVVIEEFLSGIEFSVFILTNGKEYFLLPEAKDYKKIGEADLGLNTGGMGSVSPVPFYTEDLKSKVIRSIILPTLNGLSDENLPYQGFIFFGLILVGQDPFVIEYNCRLGDPETESIMLRIENDLIDLFLACDQNELQSITAVTNPDFAATVFLVSGGYPEHFEKGKPITNHLEKSNYHIFHSGTSIINSELVTSGGRVMAISSLGKTKNEALEKSLRGAEYIQYSGKYYRKDIGFDL